MDRGWIDGSPLPKILFLYMVCVPLYFEVYLSYSLVEYSTGWSLVDSF